MAPWKWCSRGMLGEAPLEETRDHIPGFFVTENGAFPLRSGAPQGARTFLAGVIFNVRVGSCLVGHQNSAGRPMPQPVDTLTK